MYCQLKARRQERCLVSTSLKQLLPFLSYSDEQSELIRCAFYNLENLIVSSELKDQLDRITIPDRYWLPTIAYQLARTNQNDPITISWLNYLAEPALIAYIYVDEIERCRRIVHRSASVTLEKKQLAIQEASGQRLDYIY